jgi:hypothetical protein
MTTGCASRELVGDSNTARDVTSQKPSQPLHDYRGIALSSPVHADFYELRDAVVVAPMIVDFKLGRDNEADETRRSKLFASRQSLEQR